MDEIKIRVKVEGLKELTDALRALVGVKGGQPVAAVVQQTQPETTGQAFAGVPVQQPQAPAGALIQQPQVPVTTPQNYSQVPVQPTVPAAAVVQPVQGAPMPAAVPTTAMPQGYTIEQLQVAAAGLSQMGKMPQVMGILQRFGIQAMTELPKERYGEFAIALREAGAQI